MLRNGRVTIRNGHTIIKTQARGIAPPMETEVAIDRPIATASYVAIRRVTGAMVAGEDAGMAAGSPGRVAIFS